MRIPHCKVRTRRWLLPGALVVLALASSGCGAGRGDVSGHVKQGDQVLVYGTVTMLCSDGLLRPSLIKEDGSYFIRDIPAGPVKIAVESNDPDADYQSKLRYQDSPAAAAALWRLSPELRKRWVPISSTYKMPETSGLEYVVQRGQNQHDIILSLPPDPSEPRMPAGPGSLPDETRDEK